MAGWRVLLIGGGDGPSDAAAALADLGARVTRARFDLADVDEATTGALPNLFTEADAEALVPKLEPAAVREFLGVMRRKLAGPEGMVLKDVVAADPVGMSGLVVAKALPLQTGFGQARLEDGRIFSADPSSASC